MKNKPIKKSKYKNLAFFIITLLILLAGLECKGQSDARKNCKNCSKQHSTSKTIDTKPRRDLSGMTGLTCNANTFYYISGAGTIEEMQINGNVITSNGIIASGNYLSLAVCNNLNGGTFSPTFYVVNNTTNKLDYLDDTVWVSTPCLAGSDLGGIGGCNGFLYYNSGHCIIKSNGTTVDTVYDFNQQTGFNSPIADVAADAHGNIWVLEASAPQTSSFVDVISPTGQLIKQYPCTLQTNNAYGCFLLNGILYIGFGDYNPIYPGSILPISFLGNSAIIGNPLPMQAWLPYDLASCNPGSPLSVVESDDEIKISVYPVPSNKKLHLATSFNELSEYIIYGSHGKAITEKTTMIGNADIDISEFPAGVYSIEIIWREKIFRTRFIKM